MDTTTAVSTVSAEDWEKLASAAGISAKEMQAKYEATVGDAAGIRHATITTAPIDAPEGCTGQTFNIALIAGVALDGKVEFCASSTRDWTATLAVEFKVAGYSVWHTKFTLTPADSGVCFSPYVHVAKADICFRIVGDRLCFNVRGDACYWSYWSKSWQCVDFDQTLFCFR